MDCRARRARYRPPTNAEWLAACGGENAPAREENVAGPEARTTDWPARWPTFARRDPFPRIAPVGSFPPELFGLCDISGNVSEWTLDEDESTAARPMDSKAKLRGPCWLDGRDSSVRFSYVRPPFLNLRLPHVDFRLVLDWQDAKAE